MREHLPDGRVDWSARTRHELTADERALVSAYMEAHERLDVDWRCLLTSANGQPAVAMYLRRPGDSVYRAFALDVLRIANGLVAEITTFEDGVFPAFDLPSTLGD
ncbi:MAG TPA: hypothetical protein VK585_09180 [Jiangellaceae bacterium]|nr:hypothetical protein [Jiangellaceae bacterium]